MARTVPVRRLRRVGDAVLRAAEAEARAGGRALRVLGTIGAGDAERRVRRLDWPSCGPVPDDARLPQGGVAATNVSCKPPAPYASP